MDDVADTGRRLSPLRAHLLGTTRIAVGDRVIPDGAWPRRTARSLLLLLLVTPGHRLPRDRVLDLLWPEASPDSALNAFYLALSALRRVLEPGLTTGRDSAYVEVGADQVRLRDQPAPWVDADAFETGLARARASLEPDRAAAFATAVELYGGSLLPDEPYSDWPVPRRERLHDAWRLGVLEWAELELAAGRPLTPVTALERLLDAEPADEPAIRSVMTALAAGGQRDEALRRYQRGAEAIRAGFDTEPGEETRALAAAITWALPSRSMPRAAVPTTRVDNLPAPPNPLVGRMRELETLSDLLLEPGVRLVTVSGAGGIGKTRLAIETARQVTPDFEAGVCFVPLASVAEPHFLVPAIARALSVTESTDTPILDAVAGALRDCRMLLVLDTVEHLLEAATEIADLLERCSGLTVMATSREPLRLRAEHLFVTAPLAVPPPGGNIRLTPETAERYEAVTLFVRRARAARPDFTLIDHDEVSAVATLCRGLDGLPLAIELAAARVRTFTPEQLVAGLEDRLGLLAEGYRDLPARQQTMRDTIGWSHDLLAHEEQALFRRLAVFGGSWSIEAADEVVSTVGALGTDTPAGLVGLTERNLVVADRDGGEARYGMLETIREFARQALRDSGEDEATRRAHARFFLKMAERAAPELTGAEQGEWLDRLDTDHDNLRIAIVWALEYGEVELAARLGVALWRFWLGRGYLSEGRSWLTRIIERSVDLDPLLRADLLAGAGLLADHQNDVTAATALHTEALNVLEPLGDRRRIARSLDSLGTVAQAVGDYDRSAEFHRRALTLYRDLDDRWGISVALNNLGSVAYFQGDYEGAGSLWGEVLPIVRELGDVRAEGVVLNNLGAIALQRGDLAASALHHEASLALRRRLGDRQGIASGLTNLGGLAYETGDFARAETLLVEGIDLFREIGDDRQAGIGLYNLGRVMQARSDLVQANDLLRESLELFHGVGDRFGVAGALEGIAGVARERSDAESAARLFAAAATLRDAVGAVREGADQAEYDRDLAATRAALGNDAFDAAWAAGSLLTLEEAVAEASNPGAA